MKQSDSVLRQMFVRATDEVVTPAPWLESRVVDALRQHRPERRRDFDVFRGLGSGLRLTAGLVAVVLAIAVVASVLMSTRLLHNPLVPGNRSTIQTPAPSPLPFTPSPAIRAANWPPGGPVPALMAGAWQPANYSNVLHLGGYTFEFGTDYTNSTTLCGPGPCQIGNVVVNGSEIDFIQDPCGKAGFGFERFTYALTGNTLVLTKVLDSGQSNCGLLMAGTYTKLS